MEKNKNISEVELDEGGLRFIFTALNGRMVVCSIEYDEEDDELVLHDIYGHECGRI